PAVGGLRADHLPCRAAAKEIERVVALGRPFDHGERFGRRAGVPRGRAPAFVRSRPRCLRGTAAGGGCPRARSARADCAPEGGEESPHGSPLLRHQTGYTATGLPVRTDWHSL